MFSSSSPALFPGGKRVHMYSFFFVSFEYFMLGVENWDCSYGGKMK